MTSRKPLKRIEGVHNKPIEVQPLSDPDSAQLFSSLTRTLTNDEIGPGEGKPVDRLAKHETIKSMKGNPGLIVEAAEFLSLTKKVDLNGLKDQLDSLKEAMEKEDAEELPEPDEKHDDDDFTPKKPGKVLKDDDDDWAPKKPGRTSSKGNMKDLANQGYEPPSVRPQVNQAGQSFWKYGEDVSCSTFFAKLNREFIRRTGCSDRPLTKQDYEFLKGILNKYYKNNSVEIVKLEAFTGFWTWFEAFSDIIQEIPELWSSRDPLIVHLCTSLEAAEMLKSYRPGTFIIRFSESRVGFLSLAVKKKTTVEHLLIYKDDKGWNHDGDTVEDVYSTITELLRTWNAGKYIETRKKDDVLQSLGGAHRGMSDEDDGPD